MDPIGELGHAIRALPKVQLQNRLMRLSAREIAMAMRYLEEADRSIALSVLPAGKADEIREELALAKHRRLTGRDRLVFVRQVLKSLGGETAPGNIGSYLRPVRQPPRHPRSQ